MEIKRDILWRVYLSYIAVAIVCVAIISRAFYIQQVQGDMWRKMSDSLHVKIQDVAADRGTIYSADGQMLSTSVPQFDVFVDFAADGLRENNGKLFHDNLDSLSYSLAELFGDKSEGEYKKILRDGYKSKDRYFLLKRKVGYEDYKQLMHFPLVRLGKNKSGFIAVNHSIRLNPYQMLAYRTIGLDRENAQKVGLEQSYDSVLQGTEGKRLVRLIAGGVAVPVEDDNRVEPQNGDDIITTLDTRIQEISENALQKMLDQSECVYGTCVVMETATGKIKAIANLGEKPGGGGFREDYNYALRSTEPGSTIKLVSLLAVLSEGKTSVNDLVDVGSKGYDMVGGVRNVNDAERAPKPILTVKECFAHSSNVGMGKLVYNSFASDPQKYIQYLHQYGMDKPSGIDLKGEDRPAISSVKLNQGGMSNLITMGFGYALRVTPMQTLTLYNAIANNGKMVKPYLVDKIVNDGVLIKQFEPTVINPQICKPEIVKAAQDCMLAVTTEGTAIKVFKDSRYPVAGKTGTAHVADGKFGYDDGVYQASFVGYFPANKPQYTCIVVVKTKPYAAVHFGGQLAAPVFKEIADRLYTLYVNDNMLFTQATRNDSINYFYTGFKPDVKQFMNAVSVPYKDSSLKNADWISVSKGSNSAVAKTDSIYSNAMPLLAGLTLKDAVYLCENMGLKVSVKGRGKVVAQSLMAGQQVNKGQGVNIVLN
ncbi:MAG TPA: penicillin-binding protein [Panacibacter sp.]|nr:penicillin-binding protein [Panacibacter sp.]HNP44413.1 penicillin-binding protein [Panacibacter sp.]